MSKRPQKTVNNIDISLFPPLTPQKNNFWEYVRPAPPACRRIFYLWLVGLMVKSETRSSAISIVSLYHVTSSSSSS